ncbi:MAG: hypothetical protein ACYSOS_06600 [Planctomycetota bacterium]
MDGSTDARVEHSGRFRANKQPQVAAISAFALRLAFFMLFMVE